MRRIPHLHWVDFVNEAFNAMAVENHSFKFPHHNVIKIEDNKHLIELAVAGFAPEDLTVVVEGNTLTITGNITQHEQAEDINVEPTYLHKGIARRAFTKEFRLHEFMEVTDTTLKNGILSIFVEMIIPEEKQPRKVEINVK